MKVGHLFIIFQTEHNNLIIKHIPNNLQLTINRSTFNG